MANRSLFQDLKARELIYQTTDPELEKVLDEKKLSLYAGFDPTADSLHIGSLLPLLALRRFQLAGHKPIALVGGATGMIGDPSGKSAERNLQTEDVIEQNLRGIRKVMEKILDMSGSTGAVIVNNADWFKGFSYLGFLRDVGKHFSVNIMMSKDSVRSRLEDRDQGISYTEFSYMLLQAYDFYHLNQKQDCTLQIGGSDQWGNITAGTELIRRMHAAQGKTAGHSYGMTFPLVMKSDGTKFGKTEKGTVWLSPEKTSPYQLFQYFMQAADADTIKWLKYFTFLSIEEIQDLESKMKSAPEKREAQSALAFEVTKIVHGDEEAKKALQAAQSLFAGGKSSGGDSGGSTSEMSEDMILQVFSSAPSKDIAQAQLVGMSILDLLVETGLCESKGMAKKDIQGGGINLNNERVSDIGMKIESKHILHGKYILLRKGKKNYFLVKAS